MPNHDEDMKEQALKAFAGWAPKEFLTRQLMDLAIEKAIETEKADWRKQSMSKITVEEIRKKIEKNRRWYLTESKKQSAHRRLALEVAATAMQHLLDFIDGKEEK